MITTTPNVNIPSTFPMSTIPGSSMAQSTQGSWKTIPPGAIFDGMKLDRAHVFIFNTSTGNVPSFTMSNLQKLHQFVITLSFMEWEVLNTKIKVRRATLM